jgi:NhaP-type Na+/H+ or K+/H+ antiporter
MALTMVAFLLGNALTLKSLRRNGTAIFAISLSTVIVTVAVVATGLWAIGVPAPVAILLGAIATATDPAATQDAIRQSGVTNRFTEQLRAIVAIDDAWGLLAFSLAAVAAHGLATTGGMDLSALGTAVWEIGGALVLGCALGLPASYLTGRLRRGEPMQSEALGIVFLAAGLAIWFEVSFLLTGMTAGMIIANFARHHDTAFHEIEHVQ